MAKVQYLDDLPGTRPSDELVPLQFRMPADFVRRFKQEALDRGMNLTELLELCFDEHEALSRLFVKYQGGP